MGSLLAVGAVRAQPATAPSRSAQDLAQFAQPATAPLSTYVRVVSGDSVQLFYAANYRMAQPACARFRRQTRLDAAGSFNGYFRDARWPSDSVLLTGRYAHGEKDGIFTLYHPNGQVQVQGQYRANHRVGDWKLWHPSGQPVEVLSYDQQEQLTVRSAWDNTGQQIVTEGVGLWRRDLGEGNEFSGPVIAGRPTGTWQLIPAKMGPMAKWKITETYGPDGTVKTGVEHTGAGLTDRYHGASRVQLFQDRAFEAAERFQMQPPCQVSANARSTFKTAFYKTGTPAYYELLWQRIRPADPSNTMPRNALGNYQGVLRFRAFLGADGNWRPEPNQTEGTSLEAARQLLALMRNLPRWQPAHEDGVPVTSSVLIEYSYILDQVDILIQPGPKASADVSGKG